MTVQQSGGTKNYQTTWLPDGSILITTNDELEASEALEFLLGIEEEGEATLDLVYGRATSVDEDNIRTFADNTSGTATVDGSGDAEKLRYKVGQNRETEDIDTGVVRVEVLKDKYDSGFGSITVKYKTAATQGGLAGEGWSAYTVPFSSTGWAKVRVET